MSHPIAYLGTVRAGVFVPEDPKGYAMEFLRREGKRVVQTVKEWNPNRTSSQNRFWFGVVVPLFADCMGCSKQEAHEALKAELNSELKEAGERLIKIPKSTASLDKKAFSDLIEKAAILLGEMFPGTYLPPPDSVQAQALIENQ